MAVQARARGDVGIRPDDDLVSLFRRVARANPDRAALVDRDGIRTYSELDQESDLITESLRQLGVEHGQRIGLVAHRSAASVIGLLGILKAGCAYVPLDPAIPAKRREHIVKEASLAIVIDARQPLHEWRAERGATTPQDLARGGERRGQSGLSGSTAAYVIYTSGSTGVPKGCEVSHRNVVALLHSALPLFSASSDDAWTVIHSLAFDFSVLELWGAFATGGKAVMADEATVIDPHALIDLLDEQAVTIVNIVPSAFAALLASDQRRPATVRLIIFGGESVQLGVVRRFLDTGDWPSQARPDVVNMYGITETTVVSTIQRIGPDILGDAKTRSPIGEPLPHVDLKLFAHPGVEAIDGEAGEIYIGGDSVSAGYVARPELTAERFLVLTDSDGNAARYYRSGDLARRGPHGLEYCGRIDLQVKLKGFRIELEEVERAIGALPYIHAATITLECTRRELPVLVAFVVPTAHGETRDLQVSIRRDLRQILPRYMIPSHVVPLETLPTTASGKRDRAHLSMVWRDRYAPA